MKLPMTNDMSGIDTMSQPSTEMMLTIRGYVALSGLNPGDDRDPGRCPGLDYRCPVGVEEDAPCSPAEVLNVMCFNPVEFDGIKMNAERHRVAALHIGRSRVAMNGEDGWR